MTTIGIETFTRPTSQSAARTTTKAVSATPAPKPAEALPEAADETQPMTHPERIAFLGQHVVDRGLVESDEAYTPQYEPTD